MLSALPWRRMKKILIKKKQEKKQTEKNNELGFEPPPTLIKVCMSRRLTARLRLLILYWPFRNVIKSGLRDIFIDRIFKPGLLFSLSTWTRPTFDHSEVKIDL